MTESNPWCSLRCSWCRKDGATEVSKCGTCVFHKECFSSAAHCACGYNNKLLISLSDTCVGCSRNKTSDVLCRQCSDTLLGVVKGISKKGIDLGTEAAAVFLSSNGLLNQKIGHPSSIQVALNIFQRALQVSDEICVYDNKVHRVEQAMSAHLLKMDTAVNIDELAKAVGVGKKAISKFKDYHWQGKHGVILNKKRTDAKPKELGVSVISEKSLIAKLEMHPYAFQPLKPLLESWEGAAGVLRRELEANRLLIMDSKYCTYDKTASQVDPEAKQLWVDFLSREE